MAGSGPDGNENMNGEAADGTDGKFIWGTTVALQESMNLFTDFLRNFKPKYRASYNKAAKTASEDEDDAFAPPPPPPNALYDNLSNVKANETLYLTYLRTMRLTQQTNLNLDSLNLLSYPPTKKLYHQLIAYPQEVIPIMDQVLKDLMIELANEDAEGKEEGLERDLLVEDAREMAARVYKVRPFGGERSVNMRDLNPGGQYRGELQGSIRSVADGGKICRYRQIGLDQGSRDPCDPSHPRHEAR
jgi:DNA replication licensing factor MCM4